MTAYNFLVCGVSNQDICLNGPRDTKVSHLLESLRCRGVNTSSFFYVHNGSPIEDVSSHLDVTSLEDESHLIVVRAYSQLKGGKGGFGALIRAMGMRMNRNRNKDACRDLTGRRLRSVNVEKKVADLMKKEPEKRKKKAEDKAEKRRRLLEGPRHQFNDQEYIQKLEETQDNLEDALKQGLSSGSNGSGMTSSTGGMVACGKRRARDEDTCSSTKKQKLWMDAGNESLDSVVTDSEDDYSDDDAPLLVTCTSSDIPTITLPVNTTDQPSVTPSDHTHNASSDQALISSSDQIPTPISDQIPDHPLDHAPPSPSIDNDVIIDQSKQSLVPVFCYEEFKLSDYSCVEDLEKIGGDGLKIVLQKKGLKCGGTPHERAIRLWSIKGLELKDIDPSLLAVTGKGRSRNKGKKKT